jgi:hypothetical protein
LDLQAFEDEATVRIKFASMHGAHIAHDASQEYAGLCDGLPSTGVVTEAGFIETISEYSRPARRLKSGDTEVVAVEHETGLEILVVVGTNVVSTAVVGLATHLWSRWKQRRERTRAQVTSLGLDALVVEQMIESKDGTRIHNRVTIPPSEVTNDRLVAEIVQALGATSVRT